MDALHEYLRHVIRLFLCGIIVTLLPRSEKFVYLLKALRVSILVGMVIKYFQTLSLMLSEEAFLEASTPFVEFSSLAFMGCVMEYDPILSRPPIQ